MNKPQQTHVKDADNLSSGEIHWKSLASGRHRVRYRQINGQTASPFVGSPADAELIYFVCLFHLDKTLRGEAAVLPAFLGKPTTDPSQEIPLSGELDFTQPRESAEEEL